MMLQKEMLQKEMLQCSAELGFSNAVILKTEEIPFHAAFRVCCEDNSCGKYNANWSCPPVCGSTAQMEEKIRQKQYALILQSTWDVDSEDPDAVKQCKSVHNRSTRELIEKYCDTAAGFMIGASGCSLCDRCSYLDDMPCRFPEQMASCMSAYCIYVQKLAEENGMEYDSGPGLVNFFSMFVFDPLEQWDVYDRNGQCFGKKVLRGHKLLSGQYHMVACTVVRHESGRYLLMRRAAEKTHFPNVWEIGAGGSALSGETGLACARRELEEETGIDRGEFSYLGRTWDHEEHVFYEGFLCETDYPMDLVRLQKGETSDYRWLEQEDFLRFFHSEACLDRMRRRLEHFVKGLK